LNVKGNIKRIEMDDLYKTIRENLDGKYLIIHANDFNYAIDFALENKLEQIQIRSVLGKDNIVTDFKELEKLAPLLKVISFAGLLDSTIVNFDSIYSLKKLEKIYIQCKQNFTLDVSQFHLKHLGIEYWKGLDFSKAYSLTGMVISKLPDINLKRISELKNLKILHIYSSKIQTLEGIEGLPIEKMSLSRNNSLENIQSIKELKTLKELEIEKCKKIINEDLLNTLKSESVKIHIIK
jgi:hypothetical protein